MISEQLAVGSGRQSAEQGRIRRAHFFVSLLICTLLTAHCTLVAGCQPGLNRQPKIAKPDTASDFFSDGRANRPIESGTIARDQMFGDEPLTTGKREGQFVHAIPMKITDEVMARGRERFNINCALCHDRLGTGNGKVVQRGYIRPPSFQTDDSRGLKLRGQIVKLTEVPAGYIFGVITHGYGAMPSHADLVAVNDRWAIIAYIRALQFTGGPAGGE